MSFMNLSLTCKCPVAAHKLWEEMNSVKEEIPKLIVQKQFLKNRSVQDNVKIDFFAISFHNLQCILLNSPLPDFFLIHFH